MVRRTNYFLIAKNRAVTLKAIKQISIKVEIAITSMGPKTVPTLAIPE